MIIVVEGPDGAGKSTLIQSVRQTKRHFVVVQPSGYPPDIESLFRITHFVNQHPKDLLLICDRLTCISERVYGPILRNTDYLKDFPLMTGLGLVSRIVYCRPPDGNIRENVGQSRQLSGVPTRINQLIDGYDALFSRIGLETSIPIDVYDYTQWIGRPEDFWRKVTFAYLDSTKLASEINRQLQAGAPPPPPDLQPEN